MIGQNKLMKVLRCGIALLVLFIVNSCNHNGATGMPDAPDKGTIHISADESFKPVIDAQIQVYEASHRETRIIVHYKPEAECLRDFLVDSIKMVIATRGYSPNEEAFIIDSLKVDPSKMIVALDAVAVIVHPQSADSLFTMAELKQLLTGRSSKTLFPVFDGVRATSTVRFIIDSVLRGDSLGAKVVAAKSSEEVIDYIAKTPNAVGFIGVSWVGNRDDSAQLTFLQKIRLAHIESTDNPGGYVQPVQANIYYSRYPMVRHLVYILKEKHNGLAHGFANFMSGHRGQLLFRRSYLMPAQMHFTVRDAAIKE